LIVVYTQGLAFFMVSILSFSIENQTVAAILEPFSYTAIDQITQYWNSVQYNTLPVPVENLLLYNRIFWMCVGVLVLVGGCWIFSFNILKEKTKGKQKTKENPQNKSLARAIQIPTFTIQKPFRIKAIQLKTLSLFYFKSILLEPAFELQELSIWFFLIILIFYAAEIIWKEKNLKIDGIFDALPLSDFIDLAGKFIGLVFVYVLLLLILIASGLIFQILKGYYHFDWNVYFTGFFLEILPFLLLFTFVAFFFQIIANSKFTGHVLTLLFFILTMALGIFGLGHGLYKFGGIGLEKYSEMNGYGYFLKPYLWFKLYWFAFAMLLFVISVVFKVRGIETSFKTRWKLSKQRWTKPMISLSLGLSLIFIMTGIYIFYNTNFLNRYFSEKEQDEFRVAYEKTLKEYEYIVQPKIVEVFLKVDLYPKKRNYSVEGHYILENKSKQPIKEIHIQKRISDQVKLDYVEFGRATQLDPKEIKNGRTGGDGSKINFEIIISTEADQIAIAPGTLQKKWIEKERQFFHYKMEKPMVNFYSIVSARYEVLRDQWHSTIDSLDKNIDLEIYYHQGHEYNLDIMMNAMKKSFDYFNEHFSVYPYEQMRIMEYPRYTEFAQSFPGTVPYSEALGFMLDIDDEKDVDIPFFVTAHEVAHQWWGLHLVAANVKGKHMILESLAQYSALMVFKQEYSDEKVQQFLQLELDRYLQGRKRETKAEVPLDLVENEAHIYYSKGAINMYALQDYISEDSFNLALGRFIEDWNSIDGPLQKNNYPTTLDLLSYFKEVTPDTLQYLLTDLFETITIFENEAIQANYESLPNNQYKVELNIKAEKYQVDDAGLEISIPINDWIDIGVYARGANGKEELIYLEKHKILKTESTIEIILDRLPIRAGIDPLCKLIDKKIDNNLILFSN